MTRRLREVLRGAFLRLKKRLARPYATRIVQDALPKRLRRKTLYVVEDDGFEEQAAMVCPCGCRAVLHLNLLTDERPCWRVTRHRDGTATLQPSVWRQKGCMSHFWFRGGRIEWCDRYDRRRNHFHNCASYVMNLKPAKSDGQR